MREQLAPVNGGQRWKLGEVGSAAARAAVLAEPAAGALAPHLDGVLAYQQGASSSCAAEPEASERPPLIRMASNENAFGPSASVLAAVSRAFGQINRYPDAEGRRLREALANHLGVQVENLVVDSGSEAILASVFRGILRDGDEVVTCRGTFAGVRVLVATRGVPCREVPLRGYAFDLERLLDAVGPRTKLMYVANPNNPTGTWRGAADLQRFVQHLPKRVLFVLDEAYAEYVCDTGILPGDLRAYPNVLRLRSFSKAYGLAGLRIGYGIGDAALVAMLRTIKLPFEPNQLAHAAGVAALADTEHLQMVVSATVAGRGRLISGMRALGLEALPSQTNFVMAAMRSPAAAAELCRAVARRGIQIRQLAQFGLPDCVRVTVGLPDENERFLVAVAEALTASDDAGESA